MLDQLACRIQYQAPPWGFVAGLDLRIGKIAYMHRNGTIRDGSPIPIPTAMGVPRLGGPIVTAGDVAFLRSKLGYFRGSPPLCTVLVRVRAMRHHQASDELVRAQKVPADSRIGLLETRSLCLHAPRHE